MLAINPLSVDRNRDRPLDLGAKSDPGDAKVLADIVRTDRHKHRRIAGDPELAEAIKLQARTESCLRKRPRGTGFRSSARVGSSGSGYSPRRSGPSKIHPKVLSQCDILVLMRMNAPADLEDLARVFGYAPPSMLRSVPAFAKGEALLAGGFTFAPTIARIQGRLTRGWVRHCRSASRR